MAYSFILDMFPCSLLMPYAQVGVPTIGQSFPAAKVVPAVFFPAMNCPKPGHAYLQSSRGNFSTIQF